MYVVERYHRPVKRAFEIIKGEGPESDEKDASIQMAIKNVNDCIGPRGPVHTISVYRKIPRLA